MNGKGASKQLYMPVYATIYYKKSTEQAVRSNNQAGYKHLDDQNSNCHHRWVYRANAKLPLVNCWEYLLFLKSV